MSNKLENVSVQKGGENFVSFDCILAKIWLFNSVSHDLLLRFSKLTLTPWTSKFVAQFKYKVDCLNLNSF